MPVYTAAWPVYKEPNRMLFAGDKVHTTKVWPVTSVQKLPAHGFDQFHCANQQNDDGFVVLMFEKPTQVSFTLSIIGCVVNLHDIIPV